MPENYRKRYHIEVWEFIRDYSKYGRIIWSKRDIVYYFEAPYLNLVTNSLSGVEKILMELKLEHELNFKDIKNIIKKSEIKEGLETKIQADNPKPYIRRGLDVNEANRLEQYIKSYSMNIN